MKKRFLALLLVGCLLIVLGACQTEQDELYSRAVEDQKSAASVQPTADPNDPDYLGRLLLRCPMMICRGSW